MSNRIEIGHGLALNFTRKDGETTPSDVWLQFHGGDGKSAAISIAAKAERVGSVIAAGLRSWAADRIREHLAQRHTHVSSGGGGDQCAACGRDLRDDIHIRG